MSAPIATRIARLDPPRTALFICDMQERFTRAIHRFDAVESTAAKLIKAANTLDIPIWTTEQAPKSLGSTVPGLAALPKPSTSKTVPKTRFSMVLPSLNEWYSTLKNGAPTGVVLVGIESHVCITQTALDLLEQGIQVWIPADGVSSCNAAEVPLALARLKEAGAIVTTSESILFELIKDAVHPKFKDIQALIKEEKANTTENLEALSGASGDGQCTIS
ncbi:Isochorismatase hydrolase [Ceraceosorus guamensis]|uniref:Isochorismatase hydrolase n=1 Tax=Ceraceosorus guamensis TaxID=1522189 RepID=A0A316VUC5_9BASI|nr:Isochorismatase hydrolase [Ceraceosorus guamensis]PWN41199.1 Isochorismatase hydrolase [Ceraceosorus guamensis]